MLIRFRVQATVFLNRIFGDAALCHAFFRRLGYKIV
ncbi:hypothetical protein V512_007965 [Mesotoga sp. Brook.08.105.5.1]|nr:hypothetical protein V512_007965 [Mesotoga sp. Brook.08.105.5.1]RAO97293.1 hypothetical protein M388_00575 [Mesotoga sp. Brook.08.YT.4.2.5.4.]